MDNTTYGCVIPFRLLLCMIFFFYVNVTGADEDPTGIPRSAYINPTFLRDLRSVLGHTHITHES